MIDIDFYMKFDEIMEKVRSGSITSRQELYDSLEEARNPEPVVYNIETTNRCNMRCQMCPRTTMMTREMEDIAPEIFESIVKQIKPHEQSLWERWKQFCKKRYGIDELDQPSENHFFLYVITKVIQLHGYGDPLLDRNLASYIDLLTQNEFDTYFSCNPANINLEATYRMMESGLGYIKYSIESVNDDAYREIRGKAANFSHSFDDILRVLNYKENHHLRTIIVITMLNLNRRNQMEEFKKLCEAFKGLDVYIYLKSEDCQWYRKDYHGTESIHWSEPCKHPWMSMTIKSNGEVAMCMEDFNNDIVLGDVRADSLSHIWNGTAYQDFTTFSIFSSSL